MTSRMVDHHLLELPERNHRVSGWSGSKVAGRPATVVEASTGGAVAARWWIDDATGLLLGQETYDPQGLVTLSRSHPHPNRGPPPIWNICRLPGDVHDDECTDALVRPNSQPGVVLLRFTGRAGLGRVRTTGPARMCCIWSTATVCGLSVSSSDEVCCPARRRGCCGMKALAHTYAPPTPGLATWQSGTTVYTVVTDGSRQLLADAIRGLPC